MDPIAHTLFGATLAETGLRRVSRYATATLIIGANLPDVDAVTTFFGSDVSLFWRRGWTHGILAMVILPLLLAAAVTGWHRYRARAGPDTPKFDARWIVGLAFLGVWSHPLLDWMNTYGVRLLMPFDGTWFYGDTLFIIDPWFWLLTAAGVVLARSSSRRAIAGWIVLGSLATGLVLFVPMVPVGVKVVWLIGVAVLVSLRRLGRRHHRAVARAGFASLMFYLGLAYGLARLAETTAAQDTEPLEVQANPMPGVPFEHRVVLVYEDRYRVIPAHEAPFVVRRTEPTEVVEAALAADSIAGFATWMRYPYWEVEETDAGYTVTFRDLRYVDPGEPGRGIGFAEVKLSEELEIMQ